MEINSDSLKEEIIEEPGTHIYTKDVLTSTYNELIDQLKQLIK